jgi:hypothetical protein
MSQAKNTHGKRIKSKALGKSIEEEAEGIIDARVQKNKKPIELELPEEPVAVVIDDKTEEETAVLGEEAEELAAEDLGLDDEELNPFGDKWEQ